MNRRPANPVLILPALLLFSGAALADAPVAPGLLAEYFDFGETALSGFPDLSALIPDMVRVEEQVNHPSTNGAWDGLDAGRFADRFAARYSGTLFIPADGAYTFILSSDDGSRLYIDGSLVTDHGGIHGMGRKTGTATLTAGDHDLLLIYFENDGGAGLTLSWSGPGIAEAVIPASVLGHIPATGLAAPAVKMASPRDGGIGRTGDPVALSAAAWDGDMPAEAVAYLAGGIPIPGAAATNAPFTVWWTPPGAGTYALSAAAWTAGDLCATSAPALYTALDPPEGYAYGLLGEHFDFRGWTLTDFPDLRGCVPSAERVEDRIDFSETYDAWNGLPAWMTDDFASRFTGWLAVREPGEYTLYLSSDDGSRLWLDGVPLIANGGIHQWRTVGATLSLTTGLHRVRIEYFERSGKSGLSLEWKAPGLPRETVPAVNLLHDSGNPDSDGDGMPDRWEIRWGFDPDDPSDASSDPDGDGMSALRECGIGTDPVHFTLDPDTSGDGLLAEFFSLGGSDPDGIPDLADIPPDVIRIDAAVDYPKSGNGWEGLPAVLFAGPFAIRHTGYLRVPATGWHTLRLRSDDGSRLTVDGEAVIDHDGVHQSSDRSATLWLESGDHPLLLEYFDAGGYAELTLSWSGPGFALQTVPPASLLRPLGGVPPVATVTAPRDGSVYGEGNTVLLAAGAADFDGTVVSLTLLADGVPLAATNAASLSAEWPDIAAGTHLAAAVAVDDEGGCRTSAVVRVTAEAAPAGYAFGVDSRFYALPAAPAGFPAFSNLTAAVTRVDDGIRFPATAGPWDGLPAAMADRFASVHEGYLWIRESGDYTLEIRSDDGSRLWLDGALLLENGGTHAMSGRSAPVRLLAGAHPFRLEYFENAGEAGLELNWAEAGASKRPVDFTAFLRPAGNPDTDGDGMPDWWEETRGLDPLSPAPAGQDTDGDGLADLDEFLLTGTDPASPDTDGDGLPDRWEAENGTDPLVHDRLADPDGDGLCNFDELLAGTDPLDPDTDGDGLSDYSECAQLGTDPFSPDTPTIGDPVAAAVSTNGVSLAVDAAGIHAVTAAIRQEWHDYGRTKRATPSFNRIVFRVDGHFIAFRDIPFDCTNITRAVFYTPILRPGSHDISVEWCHPDFRLNTSVASLSVSPVGGVLPAEIARRRNTVPDGPVISRVSPAFIEGAARFPWLIEADVCAVRPGGTDSWYMDVPLSPDGPTDVILSLEGAAMTNVTAVWESTDLFSGASDIPLRPGSSLLFSGGPDGSGGGVIVVHTNGAPACAYAPGGSAALAFETAGEYAVQAVWTAAGGDGCATSAVTSVTCIGGGFSGPPPACQVEVPRVWECPGIPDGCSLEPDRFTRLSRTGAGAFLLAVDDTRGERSVTARIFPGGPILDVTRVDPLWAVDSFRNVAYLIDASGDLDLCRCYLKQYGAPESVSFRIRAYTASVLLDDYTAERYVGRGAFDADGCLYYDLYKDKSVASPCHLIDIYQGGEKIGEAVYGNGTLPAELR